MPKYHTTWIVIADGSRAQIVKRHDVGAGLEVVAHLTSPEAHLPSHELGSDRPGRVRESGNAAHHSIQPRQDPHIALKTAFIDSVAEHLNKAAGSKAFDRLILIAPPRSLSELKDRLAPDTAAKVAAAYGKDLTKLPLDELNKHLAAMSQEPNRP
jgi:protein required for attachment to host cells